MEHLQAALDSLLAQLPCAQEVRDRLESLVSVYPFNEYEYLISTLLAIWFFNAVCFANGISFFVA